MTSRIRHPALAADLLAANALTVGNGILVVQPGVRIGFAPSSGLTIATDGRLNAMGTAGGWPGRWPAPNSRRPG